MDKLKELQKAYKTADSNYKQLLKASTDKRDAFNKYIDELLDYCQKNLAFKWIVQKDYKHRKEIYYHAEIFSRAAFGSDHDIVCSYSSAIVVQHDKTRPCCTVKRTRYGSSVGIKVSRASCTPIRFSLAPVSNVIIRELQKLVTATVEDV